VKRLGHAVHYRCRVNPAHVSAAFDVLGLGGSSEKNEHWTYLSQAKCWIAWFTESAIDLLSEWLPADHLAYFVSDLVDQLDLSAITAPYEQEERGCPPYHPVMLTKVLLYAYCVGVFSSRKIQRRLSEDVAFRLLAAENQPTTSNAAEVSAC